MTIHYAYTVSYTRQYYEFHQTFVRTTLTQNTIEHEGPKLWNSFDASVKYTANIYLLKWELKGKLLPKYMNND